MILSTTSMRTVAGFIYLVSPLSVYISIPGFFSESGLCIQLLNLEILT